MVVHTSGKRYGRLHRWRSLVAVHLRLSNLLTVTVQGLYWNRKFSIRNVSLWTWFHWILVHLNALEFGFFNESPNFRSSKKVHFELVRVSLLVHLTSEDRMWAMWSNILSENVGRESLKTILVHSGNHQPFPSSTYVPIARRLRFRAFGIL